NRLFPEDAHGRALLGEPRRPPLTPTDSEEHAQVKVLLLNQCFYPDVVSTAQHLTDLALELAAQGHEVTVVASSRGYDDPEARFPARERWRGVDIIRIPTLGLGKNARWRRAADFAC